MSRGWTMDRGKFIAATKRKAQAKAKDIPKIPVPKLPRKRLEAPCRKASSG